ncbi:hypothetical protein IW261DRAFT_1511460 [Armillaria novae-zelandiae]|uniref:Actin-like ATPase domain-containing protein n=1 Tax=Armillaria novae-zelandiae TaxID=153914 RepID=A0AA39NTJ2_9AGAR|nr:hypothetical protein IW261DRAFT_1511460 [Armillaria novae-zelandiae]
MALSSRKPYSGSCRKLLMAFDLGTTYSGISYSVLDPGIVPEIKGVTRFPSQEHVGNDAKIPTIMYYDQAGNVRAVGAEALKENIIEQAEEDGWAKYSEFKLHLRPIVKSESDTVIQDSVPPLPPGKDIVSVFSDFFRYLFDCGKKFILESHQTGTTFWESIEDQIEFVLSHPNGWEGEQQQKMREAAVEAGLIPDDDKGHGRVHFVTEGEASLHFCIHHGLSSHIHTDEAVVIVDAGGGTVDISTYSIVPSDNVDSMAFKEITPPQCHFTGSIFVTKNAKQHLHDLLANSRFLQEVDVISECFDRTTKLRFRNADEPAYIKFGGMRDRDADLGIRSGQLKLEGHQVARFFEPSVASIINAIDEQRFTTDKTVTSVFLVGGFAASDWLFTKLQDYLKPLNITFSRPDSHVNKAVADGAVSFYLDRFVSARVSKCHYGTIMATHYDATKPEHIARREKAYFDAAGDLVLGGQYDIILSKGVQVSEDTEYRHSYNQVRKLLSDFNVMEGDILCYRGTRKNPRWMDKESDDMYPTLCFVTADVRQAAKGLVLKRRADGKSYYSFSYDIVILFGLTELKAQICWWENGVEKRGPARIVYERNL